MITVKHKKGKHAPNLGAVLYCYRKLLFSSSVKITVLFDEDSLFTVDKPTFFKVCGWKSKLADGALDKSVRERLLAYKISTQAGRVIDFYKYSRDGQGDNKISTSFLGSRILDHNRSFVVVINRVGFWPAFPWAGGNEPDEAPNNDFKYKLKIERI